MGRKGVRKFICLVLVVCFSLSFGACAESSYSDANIVFAGKFVLDVSAVGKHSKKAVEKMFERVNALESKLSINQNTVLREFNEYRGDDEKRFEISEEAYYLVEQSISVYNSTGGAFDITLNPLSRLWNVDAEGISKYAVTDWGFVPIPPPLPDYQTVLQTKAFCNINDLGYEKQNGKYYIYKKNGNKYLEIDFGGIAKGYAVDVCRDIAKEYSLKSAKINLSGNLYLFKKDLVTSDKEKKWSCGITNPRPRYVLGRGVVCAIEVENRSVVTSGDYQRYYVFDYSDYDESVDAEPVFVQHIIDPRTGIPAGVAYDELTGRYYNTNLNVCSSSIVHSSSMLADAYAKVACVLGLAEGAALLDSLEIASVSFSSDFRYALTGGVSFFEPTVYDGFSQYTKIDFS